ncbi:MAG: glycogen debranching protein GlgX [Actinomycetota bacterium]
MTGPGRPHPLGAHWHGAGTRFAVWSGVATGVHLCLLGDDGTEERIPCRRTDGVWHVEVAGVGPGQRYGYRVDGPWDPGAGHRCDPAKLLVDPYARAIDGEVRWDRALHDHGADSAPFAPKSVVVSDVFDWGGVARPHHRLEDSLIYEVHVKGATALHPDVPPELRGTYGGVAHPAFVSHLRSLGVTAVELLPVHHFVHEQRLVDLGLRNYWGYDSLGWFAPHQDYARGDGPTDQVVEFKAMVRALHDAGIEVILDVVYNHTAEAGIDGPVLSWRGLDHAAHYRTVPGDPMRYDDVTGTGNTVLPGHPNVIRTVMDSLRYWVTEMGVDGFRFDLAMAMMRDHGPVDPGASLLDAIGQDPALAEVKLIAEPWDLGPDGYGVGRFPIGWSEWNGRFRDTVRDFWRGERVLPDLASRLAGSSDIYRPAGRAPRASVNFITSHDGFPLADLVSYDRKHNEANGEDNRDGDDHNRSWNHGVEGPTDDPEIAEARRRTRRAFLATLLLSQGVPLLLGGDELGRTQGGNNNGYAQDNEVSWFDWTDVDGDAFDTVRTLVRFRQEHRALRRDRFFEEAPEGAPEVEWFRLDGEPMHPEDWQDGRRTVTLRLSGGVGGEPVGEPLLLIVNGDGVGHNVRLPDGVGVWIPVIDTANPGARARSRRCGSGTRIRVPHRSVVALRAEGPGEDRYL